MHLGHSGLKLPQLLESALGLFIAPGRQRRLSFFGVAFDRTVVLPEGCGCSEGQGNEYSPAQCKVALHGASVPQKIPPAGVAGGLFDCFGVKVRT